MSLMNPLEINKVQISTHFISQNLREAPSALMYLVNQALTTAFPNKYILETESYLFSVTEYAEAGHCVLQAKPKIHEQFASDWLVEENKANYTIKNGWYQVKWQDHTFELLILTRVGDIVSSRAYWLIADDKAAAESFLREVSRWNFEIHDEVLVFEDGGWEKSDELFNAIKSATFDGLVLEGTLKADLRKDVRQFFESQAIYQQYGVPWKRGLLYVGPPGNGKTHAVKALINEITKPCLYVKSLIADRPNDHRNIRHVFDRARETAPCILVFEDLDSIINDDNRSYFLNELDGFAGNDGILTIATTNHPEKLDAAIVNRPSRFDRKYHFNLPGPVERAEYFILWSERQHDSLRLTKDEAEILATLTDGFSFAYLKELMLSSVMAWIASLEHGKINDIVTTQAALLRDQMVSA